MQGLIKNDKEAKKYLEDDFADAIKLGREGGGEKYKRMLVYFGDIFCFVENIKRVKFVPSMATGLVLSNAITTNMEAFMRTILFVGCGTDWPKYLKSPDYLRWKASTNEKDGQGNKPVSTLYVIFRP